MNNDQRQAGDKKGGVPQIEITPPMIDAGVAELSTRRFADDIREVVEAVYLMMEIERRHAISAAFRSLRTSE